MLYILYIYIIYIHLDKLICLLISFFIIYLLISFYKLFFSHQKNKAVPFKSFINIAQQAKDKQTARRKWEGQPVPLNSNCRHASLLSAGKLPRVLSHQSDKGYRAPGACFSSVVRLKTNTQCSHWANLRRQKRYFDIHELLYWISLNQSAGMDF